MKNINDKMKINSKATRRVLFEKYNHPAIDKYGNKIWKDRNGIIHRDNGLPAKEYLSGSKAWFNNGNLFYLIKPCQNGYILLFKDDLLYDKYIKIWKIDDIFMV